MNSGMSSRVGAAGAHFARRQVRPDLAGPLGPRPPTCRTAGHHDASASGARSVSAPVTESSLGAELLNKAGSSGIGIPFSPSAQLPTAASAAESAAASPPSAASSGAWRSPPNPPVPWPSPPAPLPLRSAPEPLPPAPPAALTWPSPAPFWDAANSEAVIPVCGLIRLNCETPWLRSCATELASISTEILGLPSLSSKGRTVTRPWIATGSPLRTQTATLVASRRQQFTVTYDVWPSTHSPVTLSCLRGVQATRMERVVTPFFSVLESGWVAT